MTRSGPSVVRTASRCAGFRSARYCAGDATATRPMLAGRPSRGTLRPSYNWLTEGSPLSQMLREAMRTYGAPLRRACLLALVCAAAAAWVPGGGAATSPVEQMMGSCPTAGDVALVAGEVPFTFDA